MKDIVNKAKLTALRYINPSLTRPKYGRVIITSNCPLRCKMCTFWSEKHQDPSLEQIKHWIKEMAAFGIRKIAIGGGEPFIRKDLTDIVNEIKSYGIQCTITSSGYLVGKVPFPPVDEIVLSIDGATAKTHDAIRGMKGSWKKAVNAVEIARQHCLVKQLNFVLQKDNYHELEDFLHFAKQLEVPVSLIPVSLKLAAQSPLSKTLVEFDLVRLKDILNEALKIGNVINTKAFINLFLEKLEKGPVRHQCMAPYHCILIYSNGDLYPCGNLDLTVGNLSPNQNLEKLYAEYEQTRTKIRAGLHPFCNRCIYPDIMNRTTLNASIGMFMQRRVVRRGE